MAETAARVKDRLAPLVRAEAGCIEYGVAVDVESGFAAQGPARPDVATIVERWRDLAALTAHLAAPHMADWRQQVEPLRTGVKLQVLSPVE